MVRFQQKSHEQLRETVPRQKLCHAGLRQQLRQQKRAYSRKSLWQQLRQQKRAYSRKSLWQQLRQQRRAYSRKSLWQQLRQQKRAYSRKSLWQQLRQQRRAYSRESLRQLTLQILAFSFRAYSRKSLWQLTPSWLKNARRELLRISLTLWSYNRNTHVQCAAEEPLTKLQAVVDLLHDARLRKYIKVVKIRFSSGSAAKDRFSNRCMPCALSRAMWRQLGNMAALRAVMESFWSNAMLSWHAAISSGALSNLFGKEVLNYFLGCKVDAIGTALVERHTQNS